MKGANESPGPWVLVDIILTRTALVQIPDNLLLACWLINLLISFAGMTTRFLGPNGFQNM